MSGGERERESNMCDSISSRRGGVRGGGGGGGGVIECW